MPNKDRVYHSVDDLIKAINKHPRGSNVFYVDEEGMNFNTSKIQERQTQELNECLERYREDNRQLMIILTIQELFGVIVPLKTVMPWGN